MPAFHNPPDCTLVTFNALQLPTQTHWSGSEQFADLDGHDGDSGTKRSPKHIYSTACVHPQSMVMHASDTETLV